MPAGTNNVTDMFPELSFTLQQRDDYCHRVWQVKPRNHWTKISLWGKGLSLFCTLAASSGKRIVTVWRPSVQSLYSPSITKKTFCQTEKSS